MTGRNAIRIPSPGSSAFAESVITSGGRTIHLSGAVGFTPDYTAVVQGGVAAEARAAFDYLASALERAGAGFEHVVKLTVFFIDLADYDAYALERRLRFGDAPPASSAVQVAGLLMGARLEIEAVAVAP